MSPLLKYTKKILFVDPYFDIKELRYRETLEASLAIIAEHHASGVQCEIHFRDDDDTPSAIFSVNSAAGWLPASIPNGLSVLLFGWKVKVDGDIFHDRYLLTDRGGMSLGAGFPSVSSDEKVNLSLLEPEFCQEKLAKFERNSTVYKLVEPILQISSDGEVLRI